ncbi:alpha/beta hydrolase [Canibacter sp. lx-72]|uniref:alpha/beta fold hydrolase n=1 Tax=Canibacter zhuwentaonis TaxID=2837491 RepID=UPI001BDD6CA3|nr:alpha/beta fold hydrolase [Canibacter zhuwentaonis]MBT1018691.1 alpha/beta hydrolase [Canibacter zhuwentaonis]
MAVTHQRFTYTDKYGVVIHAQKWFPADFSKNLTGPIAADPAAAVNSIVGAVQLVHGVGEYSDRYGRFARELARAGFVVYAEDHRGHGRTGFAQHGKNPRKIGKLGRGGLRATEEAITQLTAIIKKENPDLQVAVFAHSWGSLMAQRIIQCQPRLWRAVVLSGSAYRTARHMRAADFNKSFGARDGMEWLSRDAANGERFMSDPYCSSVNIPKQFGVLDALRLFGKPKAGLAAEVPILIVSGSADRLNRKFGLQKLASDFRRAGVRDVSLRVYEGARHELLHETNRDEFVSDVMTWLTDQLTESS